MDVKTVESDIRADYSHLKLLTWILGPFTILSVLIGIITLIVKFKKIAEQEAKKKFENLFESEKERLIQLIEKQSEENRLKREKSILVLTNIDSDDSFLKKFYRMMKFDRVFFSKIDEIEEDKKFNKETMTFINDEDDLFKENIILNIINNTNKDVMLFYFGRKRLKGLQSYHNITYANSRVQLYGNIINALRYQSLLE